MKIVIDNKAFNLNVEKATDAGYLTPFFYTAGQKFKDITNGRIYMVVVSEYSGRPIAALVAVENGYAYTGRFVLVTDGLKLSESDWKAITSGDMKDFELMES